MAASSSFSFDSNPIPQWKYHIFLSFRGETRLNFTDHLYEALCRSGFITFRDDEELEKGEVIKPELLQAIEKSLCSVVVLSQNYASSTWCLDELQKILECTKTLDRGVLPIFYGVDPSDVRNQRGNFAEAFRRHEQRFGEDSNKVQSWKQALSDVANLSGYDSRNRFETELIDEIITQVWRKLESNLPSFPSDEYVGIDRKIGDMYQILEIGLDDIQFVGIWGMGGLGKTTLATLLFNQIRSQFDISCCLENVREKSNKEDGLLCLQKKLLSSLKIRVLEIDNLVEGKAKIRSLLRCKKVLLLLDDVDDTSQLESLAGKLDWFGKGSRVIVTARDRRPLVSHEVPFKVYEIEALNTDESLELFCRHAFKRNQPKEGYLKLSEIVVQYANGLPLALKVLGLHLCGSDIFEWEDAIDSFGKNPPKTIQDVLGISYKGLGDNEKNIFLDIACFFKGWHIVRVRQILENCGYNQKNGIRILTEKSLLRCQNEVFWMHDCLQEMGREIVVQKSKYMISEQSRLWSSRDIDEVLEKNMGTNSIEGIVLQEHNHEACWDPKAFSKMCKLRVLIILHGFPVGLERLPDSIKVLEWNEYPFKSLPHCVQLRKLVELKMHDCKIKQLWNGIQNFENLKFIDLSYSKDLIQTPNLSGAPNLKTLILKGCLNLVEVHQSVGQLKKLVVLNLEDCSNLKRLPSKLETNSLKDFILSGCSRLKKLSEFGENMKEISVLDLNGCNSLVCLPSSICNLKSLRTLNVSGCSKFSGLPENMRENKALESLDLSETAITEIPSFLSHLKLKQIYLRGCRRLTSNSWLTPHLFRWKSSGQKAALSPLSGLTMLKELDASFCNLRDGSIPDDFSCLSYLEKLNLSGNDFANLPLNCISNLSRLWELNLGFCPELQSLPVFPSSLRQVSVRNCGPMDVLPNEELSKLFMFDDAELRKPLKFGRIDRRVYVLSIPGSEIPTWFDKDKQKNFPQYNLDKDPGHHRSSFIVDIPDYCLSNNCKWWGIVVCFLFEPLLCNQPRETKYCLYMWTLRCQFESPETEVSKSDDRRARWFIHEDLNRGLNFHHQYIIMLSGNDEYIQEVLREGHNQLRIFFRTPIWSEDLKISKCAWRVIYKDENIPCTSNSPKGLTRPRIKEISTNEDGATTSDEELPAERRKLKQKILD